MENARAGLRLREAQLAALARALADDDLTPFLEQARCHHPGIAEALGAALPQHVARIRDFAFELGLRRTSDLHRFVDLGLVMGWPWLQRERDTIATHMADARIVDVSRRLDALFEHVLSLLEVAR